jgi:hypothetical protein
LLTFSILLAFAQPAAKRGPEGDDDGFRLKKRKLMKNAVVVDDSDGVKSMSLLCFD